jgi:hypothetical protein
MCLHEIGYVNVVADAGAIRRRIIGTEDVDFRPQAECGFYCDLDEMRGAPGRLAGAAERVGAGDVEITQDHMREAVGAPCIARHDLGHEFGGAIGRGRHRGVVFARRHPLGIAINRGGRREDEMAHAGLDGGLDQGARFHRIVKIVAERIANRVRHHDRSGEMDDGVDPMLGDQRGHERLITDLAVDQARILRHRRIETGGEIVKHHDALAGIQQRVNHTTSDIARAAGEKDRHAASSLMCLGGAGSIVMNRSSRG